MDMARFAAPGRVDKSLKSEGLNIVLCFNLIT
jgi:hypothetical protein